MRVNFAFVNKFHFMIRKIRYMGTMELKFKNKFPLPKIKHIDGSTMNGTT